MITIRAMLPLALAAMASTAVVVARPVRSAEISDADHKACVDAKDYQGCINARTGVSSSGVDVTHRPGLQREMGNDCGATFAYIGAGKCQRVICTMGVGRNHPALAGKGHSCKGVRVGLFGRPSLEFGNEFIRATNNPNCPQKEPALGYSSSCERARAEAPASLPENKPKSSLAPETYGHGPRVSVLPPPHPYIFGIGQI